MLLSLAYVSRNVFDVQVVVEVVVVVITVVVCCCLLLFVFVYFVCLFVFPVSPVVINPTYLMCPVVVLV